MTALDRIHEAPFRIGLGVRLVMTRVHGEYEGDTYFPEWDSAEWKEIDATEYDRFSLEEWVRRR